MSCELPETASVRTHEAVIPGKGGRDYRLTPGHHKHPGWSCSSPTLAGDSTAVVQHPKSQLWGGSCLQALTPLSSSSRRDARLWPPPGVVPCLTPDLPLLCLRNADISTWAHSRCVQRRKHLCWNSLHHFCQGRQESPCLAFPICHSPWSETLITEANCKTNGLRCPSPLFVALHYNDYRLTSMNCTSSKRWAAMLYNIVPHKANTEISNCLIFYLKKTSIGTKQKNVGKESHGKRYA